MIEDMTSMAARFSIVCLLVALALPSVGPLADHHFAERQPIHHHLGAPRHHIHAYNHHAHTPEEGTDASGQSTALFNYESAPAVTAFVVADDMAMRSFLLFEPSSLFLLPLPLIARAKQHDAAPPARPPQPLA